MCISCALPVLADESTDAESSTLVDSMVSDVPAETNENLTSLVTDDAELLSDSERESLIEKLQEISDEYDMDVAVHTTYTDDDMGITDYADTYFEEHDFGRGTGDRDGIILVINMDTREYWISTTGNTIYCFSDNAIEYMKESFVTYLSDGEYYEAFCDFGDVTDYMMSYKNSTGEAWGSYDDPDYDEHQISGDYSDDSGSLLPQRIIIAIAIGAIVAFSVTGLMKAKMKSVKSKASARGYYDPKSLRLKGASDTFLYTTLSKVLIKSDSGSHGGGGFSSHSSSGGISHGGGGGRF